MNTQKFKVTYPNGDTAEVSSTCATVEEFAGQTFSTDWPAAQANGAKVELVEGEASPVENGEEGEAPRVPVVHEASGSVEGMGAASQGG